MDAGGKGDLIGPVCGANGQPDASTNKEVVAVAMANLIGTGQETIIKRLGM